ncbi:MAG: hypothetical protein ACK5ND_04885 [Bacteroides sp.]
MNRFSLRKLKFGHTSLKTNQTIRNQSTIFL